MSRMDPRLYCHSAGTGWVSGQELSLSAGHAHYLGKVMRLHPGKSVRLFNGVDGEWKAIILELRRSAGRVRLVEPLWAQRATDGVELLFSPLKRDATELVIRMGTEMGVTRFRPIVTARTNTHRINLERLHVIAQEASEQCERLDVPDILPLEPLAAVLARWPRHRPIAVALERQKEERSPVKCAAFLVGPEGGFSEEEIQRLKTHDAVQICSLGPLILRAETAVVAGLACVSSV